MENEKLAETILECLIHLNQSKISCMNVMINPEDDRNLKTIKTWVDNVWSKEQL